MKIATIKRIGIQNFTLFSDLKIEPVSGLNFFLGANSTGKTHLLKLIHTIHEVFRSADSQDYQNKERAPLQKP